jgi:putative nucleotidyltransferase with HDIG domain
MTFLIAQLMFVPVYLKVTDTCTENKGTFWQKIKIISISPFAVYLYVNIFFAFAMAFIPASIAENLVMSADVFVISLSFIFVNLYAGICCKIASWDKIYYASIYLSFFLLQMVFNYTYVTAAGSVVCNILVPLIIIWYYIRKLMPLYISIKKKPEVKVSRSLFLLPAMAELFFIYRSFVIIAISAKYPEVALNDMYANAILTGFSYILTGFVFVCMTTLLKNILDEQEIKLETKKNKELTTDMIKALVKTIDAKDPYTNGHSIRVAEYTRMLAEQVYTDQDEIHSIYNIALLHDIGKIGIPDSIISKPGKLTDEEYNIIKGHTLTGAKILSEIKSAPELIYGAKYHHERYDGKGYPCGLKGEEIPEISAIIAVADAYDAMTSNRSYRKLLPQETVKQEIEKGLGTQFNPKWGKIMLKLIEKDKDYKMHQ